MKNMNVSNPIKKNIICIN